MRMTRNCAPYKNVGYMFVVVCWQRGNDCGRTIAEFNAIQSNRGDRGHGSAHCPCPGSSCGLVSSTLSTLRSAAILSRGW